MKVEVHDEEEAGRRRDVHGGREEAGGGVGDFEVGAGLELVDAAVGHAVGDRDVPVPAVGGHPHAVGPLDLGRQDAHRDAADEFTPVGAEADQIHGVVGFGGDVDEVAPLGARLTGGSPGREGNREGDREGDQQRGQHPSEARGQGVPFHGRQSLPRRGSPMVPAAEAEPAPPGSCRERDAMGSDRKERRSPGPHREDWPALLTGGVIEVPGGPVRDQGRRVLGECALLPCLEARKPSGLAHQGDKPAATNSGLGWRIGFGGALGSAVAYCAPKVRDGTPLAGKLGKPPGVSSLQAVREPQAGGHPDRAGGDGAPRGNAAHPYAGGAADGDAPGGPAEQLVWLGAVFRVPEALGRPAGVDSRPLHQPSSLLARVRGVSLVLGRPSAPRSRERRVSA